MFENIVKFFKKIIKAEQEDSKSKDTAKERLHLVLMQDRANVSADFLELMKQEIIEVIKKYIDVDEKAIDVRLTNKTNEDGTNGAPALYANIPILNIKNENKKEETVKNEMTEEKKENEEEIKEEQREEAIEENVDIQKENTTMENAQKNEEVISEEIKEEEKQEENPSTSKKKEKTQQGENEEEGI